MRNLMQLVGGVVVAGAVAAGSTAFTANGVSASALTGANIDGSGNIVAGGSLAAPKSVVGARLTEAVFTHDATNPERITGVTIKIDGGVGITLPSTSSVKVKIAGSGTSTNAGAWYGCTHSATVVWNCLDAGGYYNVVNSLDVAVAATAA